MAVVVGRGAVVVVDGTVLDEDDDAPVVGATVVAGGAEPRVAVPSEQEVSAAPNARRAAAARGAMVGDPMASGRRTARLRR